MYQNVFGSGPLRELQHPPDEPEGRQEKGREGKQKKKHIREQEMENENYRGICICQLQVKDAPAVINASLTKFLSVNYKLSIMITDQLTEHFAISYGINLFNTSCSKLLLFKVFSAILV